MRWDSTGPQDCEVTHKLSGACWLQFPVDNKPLNETHWISYFTGGYLHVQGSHLISKKVPRLFPDSPSFSLTIKHNYDPPKLHYFDARQQITDVCVIISQSHNLRQLIDKQF